VSNRAWKIVLALTTAVGVFVGYRLAGTPNLQPYKLLNVVGLLYSLLAVFVLSEVLVASANWKRICVEWIAPVLLWVHITVPVGAAIGAGLAWLVGRGPSASIVAVFGFGAFGYMGMVGLVLEQTVVLPRIFKKDIESRWRYFGLVLLSSGMLLQLISAIKGL
jgi:hypothetical protein